MLCSVRVVTVGVVSRVGRPMDVVSLSRMLFVVSCIYGAFFG